VHVSKIVFKDGVLAQLILADGNLAGTSTVEQTTDARGR